MRNTIQGAMTLALGVALAAGLAGCRVQVDKGANGEDKKVQVETPFGGIHVNTDRTTAVDLGLPVYPGAQAVKGDGDHNSADVQLGFGPWQLKVKVVSYESSDSQDKVAAFYKKALGRYGDVITCQDKTPVGKPTVTAEGLDCLDDGKHDHVHIDQGEYHFGGGNLELKAGSKRHQHIVGFEYPKDGKTRYSLVALDLPANVGSDNGKSD
jgi:hypothetical protein